jgi:hypothetical protein
MDCFGVSCRCSDSCFVVTGALSLVQLCFGLAISIHQGLEVYLIHIVTTICLWSHRNPTELQASNWAVS